MNIYIYPIIQLLGFFPHSDMRNICTFIHLLEKRKKKKLEPI